MVCSHMLYISVVTKPWSHMCLTREGERVLLLMVECIECEWFQVIVKLIYAYKRIYGYITGLSSCVYDH